MNDRVKSDVPSGFSSNLAAKGQIPLVLSEPSLWGAMSTKVPSSKLGNADNRSLDAKANRLFFRAPASATKATEPRAAAIGLSLAAASSTS